MINNRQAGRRRGRGGQQQRSQGGAPGRPDNGNRIDNRARGNAAQLLEKYKTLARDAQMQGDRVNVEYYLQFADHYFRVLAETRARFEENGGQPQGRRPQGATLDDDETDFEDEGERAVPGEQQGGGYRQDERGGNERGNGSYNGNGNGNGGSYAQRDDRAPREERVLREDRGGNRMNARRDGASQSGEDREAEQPRAYQREDRIPREDRAPREERNATPREERVPAPRSDVASYAAPEASVEAVPADPPKRGRGRPRRDATPVATKDAPVFDADRLPPSLALSAIVPDGMDGDASAVEEKPRRRRGRPPANVAAADAE